MSASRECLIFSYQHAWYYLLEDDNAPRSAWEWREYATPYGPFGSEPLARQHLIAHHPNPGSEERTICADPLEPIMAHHIAQCPAVFAKSLAIVPALQRAIATLHSLRPESPVIAWWTQTGQQRSYLLLADAIPFAHRPTIAENLAYIQAVLTESEENRDALDLEYGITRLVSEVESLQDQYQGSTLSGEN